MPKTRPEATDPWTARLPKALVLRFWFMNTIELPKLLEFLISKKAHDFEGSVIDDYLASTRLSEDALLPFIHFREDTYGRNLVYRTDEFEILVLTWLPGQHTAIHDHASQRCWMFIESGELCFKNYAIVPGSGGRLKPTGPVKTLAAGEKTYIDDDIGLHSIANASKKPAVSFHLYAAPIQECKIYNESRRRLESVQLNYLTEADWSADFTEVHSRLASRLDS